jgi:hypothetical protein
MQALSMYFKPINFMSVADSARHSLDIFFQVKTSLLLKKSLLFRKKLLRGCLVAVVLYAQAGFAEVYKCRSLEGQLKYQDHPCGAAALSSEKMALGNPTFRREHEVQGLLIQLRKRLEGEQIATESLYTLDARVKHYGDAQCKQLVGDYAYKGLKIMENDAYQQQWKLRKVRMMPVEFLKNTEQQVQAQTIVSILTPAEETVEKRSFSLWVDVRFGAQAPRILEQRLCSLDQANT